MSENEKIRELEVDVAYLKVLIVQLQEKMIMILETLTEQKLITLKDVQCS